MFSDFNNDLSNYPSFSISNGMILQEAMREKNIGFAELFPILGPRSVVLEIINGKRSLKMSQIKQLSELFGMGQDVFNLESISNEGNAPSFSEEKNQGMEHFSHQEEGYPEMENNEFLSRENNDDNQRNMEEGNGENQFGENDSENSMKPFWED